MRKPNRMTGATNKASNKYWENENPIITETRYAEIHYFQEAGKIQLYPTYEKDGEIHLGRACVWDIEKMDVDDVLALAYGFMKALLDVGVENNAFADAFNLLDDEINADADENDNDEDAEVEESELDEEFEDDDAQDVEAMLLDLDNETLKIAYENLMDTSYKGRFNRSKAIKTLMEECSDGEIIKYLVDDEENDIVDEYIGKNVIFKDSDYEKATKKVKSDYIDWCDDADEWVSYILETSDEINSMPTKTKKQKEKQDEVYAGLKEDVADWISAWEDDEATNDKDVEKISSIVNDLMFNRITRDEGMALIVEIIDGLDL